MDIRKVIADYDAMFGTYSLTEIENYLYRNLDEARRTGDAGAQITLLNEIIGFCRDTSQREKALSYCDELKQLLDTLQMQGSVGYATALLNIANAYRAFGLLQEAAALYETVLKIYKQNVDANDFMYASLYNNWSLVYQEAGDYNQAREMLLKALKVLEFNSDAVIPQATTRVNLANALLQMGNDAAYDEAVANLRTAIEIFEKDGGRDFHYSAALVAMGDACSYRKDFREAVRYYEAGLREIEKHTGHNANYDKVKKKLEYARNNMGSGTWVSNMEKSRAFYEKYGKPMIAKAFPEYKDRIAVGLAGEGSDCFGFDDEISMDHDYAPGFCMWLTNEDYDKIGQQLQLAYDELIKNVYEHKDIDRFIGQRRGVMTIDSFYERLLRSSGDYQNGWIPDLAAVSEAQLAAAVNGSVFTDGLGVFTGVRNRLLGYYSEDFRRRKLAQAIHEFSQYAQSNYPRMMARGDQLTAGLCIAKASECAMDILYLLERRYAPYYKWKKKGLEKSSAGRELVSVLDKVAVLPEQSGAWKGLKYDAASINLNDSCVALMEQAAAIILRELQQQGLVSGDNLFLESHVAEILQAGAPEQQVKSDLIEKIIALEWKQFDQVQNQGGRASCQDDHRTFYIMRKSQYLPWPVGLLESFCRDLEDAENRGWNLITEKYARMMESTNPEQYAALEDRLPFLNSERKMLQEAVIKIQREWAQNFASEFPKLAGNSRSISAAEDGAYNTSSETYLRGEISTYSDKTFALYAAFVTELLREGRNLTRMIMENTVKMYGYESLQAAEDRI